MVWIRRIERVMLRVEHWMIPNCNYIQDIEILRYCFIFKFNDTFELVSENFFFNLKKFVYHMEMECQALAMG